MAYQIDNATAAAAAPAPPAPGVEGFFTNGNPGGGLEATDVDDWWLNMVQGEILGVLSAAGIAPDKTNNTQMATAIAHLISTAVSAGRIPIPGGATFYVSAAGNDANTGLTVGSPWLTIQHALTTIRSNYDLRGAQAVIQMADGAYTSGLTADGAIGATGPIIIQGNMATPANVTITLASGNCFNALNGANITVQGLKLSATGSGASALATNTGGVINFNTVEFGVCGGGHCNATGGGVIFATGSYKISGAAGGHWLAGVGQIECAPGITVTLAGTPAMTDFAAATGPGYIYCPSVTFTGSATGTRYAASLNGVINTGGGGASYLPGSIVGSTSTGGQYG